MCKIVFFLLSLAIISVLENDGLSVALENVTNNTDNSLSLISKNLSSSAADYKEITKKRSRRTLVLFVPENDESKYQDTSAEDSDFQNHKTKRSKSTAILHKVKLSLPSKDAYYANKESINPKILVQRDIMLPNMESIENYSDEIRPNVRLVGLKELKTPSKSVLTRKSLKKDSSEDNTALVEALKGSLRVRDYGKTISNRKEKNEGCDQKNYVCYCREENCRGRKLKKKPSDPTQIPYVKQSLQLKKDKPNRENQRLITKDENNLRNIYESVNRPKDIFTQRNRPPVAQQSSKTLPNLLLPVGAPTLSKLPHQNLNNYHILPVYQHIPAGFAIPVTKTDPNGGLNLKVGLPLPQYDEMLQRQGNSDEQSCESDEDSDYAESDVVGENRDYSLIDDDEPRYLGKTMKNKPWKDLNFEDCIKMYGREFCVISGTFAPPTSMPRDSEEISESTEDCSDDFPHSANHAEKGTLGESRNVQGTQKINQYSTKNLPDYSTYANTVSATIKPSTLGVTSGIENVDKSYLQAYAKQNFGKNTESDEPYIRDDNLASNTDHDPEKTTFVYNLNEQNMKIGRTRSRTEKTCNYPHYTKPFLYTEKPIIVGLTNSDIDTSTFTSNTNEEQSTSELSTIDDRTQTFSQAIGDFQTDLAKQSTPTLGDDLTSTDQDSSKAAAMTIKYLTFHKPDGTRNDVTNMYFSTDTDSTSTDNSVNHVDSYLGNTLYNTDSETHTWTPEYFSTYFATDEMQFTDPTTTELEMFETSTDPADTTSANNIATETSNDSDAVMSNTYSGMPTVMSTIVKELPVDAIIAQATKSPILGKSKVYIAERKEFNPSTLDESKYTSESTQSLPFTLNEDIETSTMVGITYLNSQENYSDESSTMDYNTDLVSTAETINETTDQFRVFTDPEVTTTNPYELHIDSSTKSEQYPALSMVPTTYKSVYVEEISDVSAIPLDTTSTEDSLIGATLITDKTDENANEIQNDTSIFTSSTDIISTLFDSTEDYSDESSTEETSWAVTEILDDQSDVTEAYEVSPDKTDNIIGITAAIGDRTEQDESILGSQDEHITKNLTTSTDLHKDSLPFCDNTLLLNAVKMVLNNFASNKSTDLDEYTNLPLEHLRNRTESLLPEIVGTPNLKEFLQEPRVENMMLGNIQTFLSRITGIQENTFTRNGIRKIMQDALRNVALMIPGLQEENKLPPMTVEEHQFKGGKWTTNLATLAPGVLEQTRKPGAWEKAQNLIRELLDHAAVGNAKDLKPTLKNIIVATAKNTIGMDKSEVNNKKIDDPIIRNILDNILSHERPIDIEEIKMNDELSPKTVKMNITPTNHLPLTNSGAVEENISTEFSKATKSNEGPLAMYDKEHLFGNTNPYQKATSFTAIPKELITFKDPVPFGASGEQVDENLTEGSSSTSSIEYSGFQDNKTALDYALLGESEEKMVSSSADMKYPSVSIPKNIENFVTTQPTTAAYEIGNTQNEEAKQIGDENEDGLMSDSPEKLPTKYYSPKDRILSYIKNHQPTPAIEYSQLPDGTEHSSEGEEPIIKNISQIPESTVSGESIEKSTVIVGKSTATQVLMKSTSDYGTTTSGSSNVPFNENDSYSESPANEQYTSGIRDSYTDQQTVSNISEMSEETSTEESKEASRVELTKSFTNESNESSESSDVANMEGKEAINNTDNNLPTVMDWSSTDGPTSTVSAMSESSSEDYAFKLTTPDIYEFVGATAGEGKLQSDSHLGGESNEPQIDVNKSDEVESEELNPPFYESTVKTHEITTETRKTVTKTTVYRGSKSSFTASPVVSQRQNIYCKNKTTGNEETISTCETPGNPESEEDLMYLGKIMPNGTANSTQDLSGLLNSNLYYIGDGVKLPLEIKRLKDGSYGLSISEKICQRVMKKKCPCCVPLEGSIVHTTEEKADVENGMKKSVKRSSSPGMQTKTRRNTKDGKKQLNRRLKRSLPPNLTELETTSMPVIDFAKKYNLSLNVDEEETINNVENTTNVGLQINNNATFESAMRGILPLSSKVNKTNNFGQSTATTDTNYVNTDEELEKHPRQEHEVRARKFNFRNEAKKKRRAQYRYQRNVDENARKRTKTLKSILFWLKDLFVPDNSDRL